MTTRFESFQVAFIVLLRMTQLWAFSEGPPLSTCETMEPHHHTKAQLSPSPYNISVSRNSYSTNESLTVTISGLGSQKFNGFILQARGMNSSVAWPVGKFTEIPEEGAQFVFCSGGDPTNTVGNNNPKKLKWTSLDFKWKAPTMSAGDIIFFATITENYTTYWEKVKSTVITGPPAEYVVRGVSTESFQIDKTGCGTAKGCFSLPSDCRGSDDCNFLFTYQVSGGNVFMEMSAKQRWVSVAFNEQQKMDKMDCILCATMANDTVELRHYSSRRHSMDRQILAGNHDLVLNTIGYEDGTIKCRVTRKLTSNAAYFRDLTKKWYILFSHGPTSATGSGLYHSRNRTFTAERVDISVPAILIDGQSQIKNIINKDGCGKTKSCYSEPANCKGTSDCDFLVTIRPLKGVDCSDDNGEVEFELSTNKDWAAIGFNKEKKMAGTDSLICMKGRQRNYVRHFVADNGYGTPTRTRPTPSSLVKTLAKSENGVLSCRFKRLKRDPKMVDLTQPWYLVYASGPNNDDGSIGIHTSSPKTSPEKIKVCEIATLVGEKKDTTLIKVHGCLMIIAWVGSASVGIFMARYMKVAFGKREMLGTKVWFTFHRALLVFTVLVTIIATVIIFIHAGHWMPGAHTVVGIIVLVLAVIQPIMAWFRPHPGDSNRYLFNWAHRGVGLSSLVLAVAAVFLGIRMEAAGLDDSPLYAMIVYCVGVAFVIVFDFYISLEKSDNKKEIFSLAKELNPGDHVKREQSVDKSVSLRRFMLGFLVLLVSCVVMALVLLIAVSKEQENESNHDH